MKTTRNVVRVIGGGVFLLVVGIVACLWLMTGDEVTLSLEDVPPAARAVILKEAGNGTIRKIERTSHGNRQVYAAEIVVGSLKIEIDVDAGGEVLDRDEEDFLGDTSEEDLISLDEAPAGVRDAILKEAGGAEITELERKRHQGKPIYAAEFLVNGKEIELWVGSDGTVISRDVKEPE